MTEPQQPWTPDQLQAVAEHIGLQKPPDEPEPAGEPIPGVHRNCVPLEGHNPAARGSGDTLRDLANALFGNTP